jgi:hypothetical protein
MPKPPHHRHLEALTEVESLLSGMRADDATLLREQFAEEHTPVLIALLHAYYHDLDRADRTPRGILYLHLGLLIGLLDKPPH